MISLVLSDQPVTASALQGTVRQELVDQVLVLNRQVFARMRLAGAEAWANAEITLVQLKVLLLLQAEQQMSVSGVSDHLGVHISTAGQLLDRMVRQGLIQRRPNEQDRRVIVTTLSQEGERVLQSMYGSNRDLVAALDRLSDQELEVLATGMRALARETRYSE